MDEEEVEFEPEEMLDKPFHFWIHIGEATIPAHYSNIYVDYAFKVSEFVKESFKSKEVVVGRCRLKKRRRRPTSSTRSCTPSLSSLRNC